ncbi:hypothetical protein F2Q68_00044424 [Brassica cretica]|uniref:Uncharacterized protein n=1 Tax=Brassica cretica TaxID=69181 RepID=A0A8S9LRU1_BRACR|nr:hypothetical protein F2Q68_00044424 [Brassica cretica]
MSVAYASSVISSPWLFVSDMSDFIFGTSLPWVVASSIDVHLRLLVDMLLRLSIDADASGRRAMYL